MKLFVLIVLAAGLLLAACGNDSSASENENSDVQTSKPAQQSSQSSPDLTLDGRINCSNLATVRYPSAWSIVNSEGNLIVPAGELEDNVSIYCSKLVWDHCVWNSDTSLPEFADCYHQTFAGFDTLSNVISHGAFNPQEGIAWKFSYDKSWSNGITKHVLVFFPTTSFDGSPYMVRLELSARPAWFEDYLDDFEKISLTLASSY